jgi:iron complex transport system substrate-binding protein
MKTRLFTLLAVSVVLVLLSVSTLAQEAPESNLTDGCVENYDESVDYFPEKAEIEYAQGFSVEYFNNYKLVTILTPWELAEEVFEYVLVQCGTPAPEGYDDSQVVNVPVETMVAMSTTFLPHLDSQGLVDRLVGLDTDSMAMTGTETVLERVEAGELAGVGYSWEPDIEAMIDVDADIYMVQQFAPGPGVYTSLQEVELPAVLNADFMDTTPLGQAEWGKYISLVFNTEALANETFEGVVERYQVLAALTADVEERPTAFAGSPFQDTWHIPGGNSYVGILLEDAGADYAWGDDASTRSLYLDFETVLERAGDAEYWINASGFWYSLDDALAEDERYATFAAFENGNLYTYNAQVTENGGIAYFESGLANPDVLLADLIAILHPELLPDHTLEYYQRLP